MDVTEVRAMLVKRAVPSGAFFAQVHGLSASYVNEVISGARKPGEKILSALGLEKVITYRRRDRA